MPRNPKNSPQFYWAAFKEYKKLTEKNVLYKSELIKSGQNAGQIVDIPVKPPMLIQGYCLHADIDMVMFNRYLNKKQVKDEELSEKYCKVFTRINFEIKQDQISGGMAGIYNPMLTARLNHLAEHTEQTNNGESQKIVIQLEDKKPVSLAKKPTEPNLS